MTDPLPGIVHSTTNGGLSGLPLKEVAINVFLVDVSARVTLRQAFSNPDESTTSRAKYIFPVPSRAAVCAFEIRFEDGRVIIGKSKENTLAAEEYQQALQEGKAAALVEWVTDDVFTISIGSIPAKQIVTTKLVFIMDLMDDDLINEVRLQLPMSVGDRYGTIPPPLVDAASASSSTRLRITVDIQMSGSIRQVSSPSHTINLDPFVTSDGLTSCRRKTAKLRSQTFLNTNFVLTVRADGLDAPRCFAERHPTSGTIALQMTLIPKVRLPPLPTQEYLFVVDRSGSMANARINVAKEALALLLRLLPQSKTIFNIFSFGSVVDSLWEYSQDYTHDSLNSSTEHVKGMTANYGGTETANALQYAFSKRNPRMATAVFILTDGEVHDINRISSVVANAVQISSVDAPLRVFSLGIGNTVSTGVVEGIARVGNGECLFAVESERIIGKCMKLLRGGRSRFVDNVSIDWGFPENPRNGALSSVSFSTSNSLNRSYSETRLQLPPPPAIQQTPPRITKIYPGMRFVVFALTTHKTVPKQVILRGQLNGGDGPFEIKVPVSSVAVFRKKDPDIPLVHTLAARHLITDFVEDRVTLPAPMDPALTVEDVRKAAIIRFGEEYQLASKFTSFVAVDKAEESFNRGSSRGRHMSRRQRNDPDLGGYSQRGTSSIESYVGSAWTYASVIASGVFSMISGIIEGTPSGRQPSNVRQLPGTFPSSSSDSSEPVMVSVSSDEQDSDSADSFSTMSSLEGSFSDWSPYHSPERRTRVSSADAARMRSPSPSVNVTHAPTTHGGPSHVVPGNQLPPPSTVIDLVMLQSFDGSFSPSPSLGQIVGESALQKPADVHGDDTAWATALAVAFLEKHLANSGQPDLLDGLLDKVMEFIEQQPITPLTFASLVARAKSLVA